MTGKFCVCGCRVEANTGGYDCPRCFRHYSVKGKLIGNNQMIQFFEDELHKNIKKLQARIAELEAENARLEKLNSAALEKLSYLACPPNRNNYGLPCNDSDDCVACWCEYLSGCG